MNYCLKLFFLYEGYMVYKPTIIVYRLILMEGPCSYTIDSRKNNRYFIIHRYMLDNIQACVYHG